MDLGKVSLGHFRVETGSRKARDDGEKVMDATTMTGMGKW